MTATKELLPYLRDLYGSHVTGYHGRGKTFNRGALTDDVLRGHLAGRLRAGTYFDPGDGTVILGVIDFDNEKNPEGEKPHAKRAAEALANLGLSAEIFSSKSKGYHDDVFFDKPVPAWAIRKVLRHAAAKAGRPGAEIFPKQDKVDVYIPPVGSKESARVGNFINLPFHGADLPHGRTALLNKANGLDPYPDQVEGAEGIKKNSIEDLMAALTLIGEDLTPPARKPAEPVGEKMAEAAGDKLPIETLAAVFEKCAEMDGMRRNAIEAGRLLPENKPGEHLARIRVANVYRAFEGGEERAVREIFSRLDDYNARETEEQIRSLTAPPPPCRELCPGGSCDAIKALGKSSPIAFAYQARRKERPAGAAAATEAAPTATPAVATDLERFPLSDAGNAELLASLHGDDLRFDSNQNRRLTFGPHLWREDKNGAWVRLAIKTARQRYLGAVNAPERKREAIARFALRAEDRNRITATLALAESLPPIADTGEEWDADPMLLGGPNGVTDLRTGKLRAGRREDKITKSVGVPFDLNAPWTRWERFLLEIFDGNKELVDFVWRAAGYSITGSTREQVIFLLYGAGANGKTTFLNAIRRALGQYAHNAPFSTFEHDGRSSIPADVADLAGCRFITSSETGEASRLNEQRVKVLTGGDPVTARGFYKPFFTFTPTGKPWLSVNHKPRVTDDSHGFWRRVRLIPFLRQFKEDADRNLERILAEEAPGILAWAIRGALEWQTRGLTPPAIVTDAVEDYRRESDPLGEFIAARCIVAPECAAPSSMLYREYQAWAKDAGLREREQLTNTSFGRRLGARFKKERRKGGVEYQGIGILGGGE